MKIIFAGTPDFAAVALKHLIDAGHEIALVLSQPDRPSGRGMKLTPSPVKKLALEHGIPVITPVTLSLKKAPEESARIHADLKAVGADLLVVAAYGLILPQAVLDCAKGIGRNVATDSFLAQFDGMDGTQNITLGQGYDAYSGATISSKALFAAINDCINCYNELA